MEDFREYNDDLIDRNDLIDHDDLIDRDDGCAGYVETEFVGATLDEALEVYERDKNDKTLVVTSVAFYERNRVDGAFYRHMEDGVMVYEYVPDTDEFLLPDFHAPDDFEDDFYDYPMDESDSGVSAHVDPFDDVWDRADEITWVSPIKGHRWNG